jgi:hypothetical protein
MQTGSSGTLIGWKSGQTTFVPLWDRMEGAWLRTQSSPQSLWFTLSTGRPLSPPPEKSSGRIHTSILSIKSPSNVQQLQQNVLWVLTLYIYIVKSFFLDLNIPPYLGATVYKLSLLWSCLPFRKLSQNINNIVFDTQPTFTFYHSSTALIPQSSSLDTTILALIVYFPLPHHSSTYIIHIFHHSVKCTAPFFNSSPLNSHPI